jgi:sugar lactone lactonase YvrE
MLWDPFDVARDPTTGTLYISDYGNHRIMSYTSGASTGTVVAGGNGQGLSNNNTQLNYPNGLYFDSLSNSLVIANYGANNIVRWVLGDSSWTLITGDDSGLPGNTSTLFNGAVDITFDPMGNMFVVDRRNHRIQFFSMGQTNGTTIAGITGISGANSSLLNFPRSIQLDSQLNLYVADTYNHRIQKFVRY